MSCSHRLRSKRMTVKMLIFQESNVVVFPARVAKQLQKCQAVATRLCRSIYQNVLSFTSEIFDSFGAPF